MRGRYGIAFAPRPLKRKEIGEIKRKAREWGQKNPAPGYRRPKSL